MPTQRESFESRLRAEGYPEIRVNEMEANRSNPEHEHPFDVRALILDGDITLTIAGQRQTYRAGQEFSMKAGCRHIEDVGPQGVKYLVGRRPVT
jgi:quercetin dioxygenase-like cupin family protein